MMNNSHKASLAEGLEEPHQQGATLPLPRGWVVTETSTGAMDGVYKYQRDAEGVLARMKQRYPDGKWFLFALHSDGSDGVIPDAMFWKNRLGTPRDI